MSKLVKDFIEIKDTGSLDELIERLVAVRETLSEPERAQVKMRGDDIFGRHISVSYYREQTEEEAACDARYADAYRQSRERELSRLQDELGFRSSSQPRRRLRAVA